MEKSNVSFRRFLPIPSVYTMKMRSLKIPSVDPSVPFRVHHFSFREQTTSKSNSPRLFRNMVFLYVAEDKGVILRALMDLTNDLPQDVHVYWNLIRTTHLWQKRH